MNELVRKLTSRKLWAAIAGVVAGLAMVFGLDENMLSTTAGAVMACASLITYIVTEGKVDAARVKNAIEAIQGAKEALDEDKPEGN